MLGWLDFLGEERGFERGGERERKGKGRGGISGGELNKGEGREGE